MSTVPYTPPVYHFVAPEPTSQSEISIPKHDAWPRLRASIGTSVNVRGFFTGYRFRKCKEKSERNGAFQPQITLAPVWIGNVLIDHMHVDLTLDLDLRIRALGTAPGDECFFTAILFPYLYTGVLSRRSRLKLGLQGVTNFSSVTIPYDSSSEEWSESRNQQNIRSWWESSF